MCMVFFLTKNVVFSLKYAVFSMFLGQKICSVLLYVFMFFCFHKKKKTLGGGDEESGKDEESDEDEVIGRSETKMGPPPRRKATTTSAEVNPAAAVTKGGSTTRKGDEEKIEPQLTLDDAINQETKVSISGDEESGAEPTQGGGLTQDNAVSNLTPHGEPQNEEEEPLMPDDTHHVGVFFVQNVFVSKCYLFARLEFFFFFCTM